MGKRGPKPQPSAVQKRKGTHRADRRRNELTVETAKPRRPQWLSDNAKRHWDAVATWLHGAGLLTALDQIALALLCEPLADYLEARAIIEAAAEKSGTKFVATTDKGNIIQHPAVGVMNKAWERVVKLLREFGMTPSARVGLKAGGGDDPEDPLAALMRKRMEHFGNN